MPKKAKGNSIHEKNSAETKAYFAEAYKLGRRYYRVELSAGETGLGASLDPQKPGYFWFAALGVEDARRHLASSAFIRVPVRLISVTTCEDGYNFEDVPDGLCDEMFIPDGYEKPEVLGQLTLW